MYPAFYAGQSMSRLVIFALVTILFAGSLDLPAFTANANPTLLAARSNRLSLRQENNTLSVTPPACSNPVRDTCNFYADCLEAQYHCGPDGYPIRFGQAFCQKFSANRAKLSTEGRKWLSDTTLCLQKTLVPEAISTTGVTCDSIEQKAFPSHGRCFVDSGFCTLPPSDWVTIVEIVELKTIFNTKEVFLAALDTGKGCLKAYLFFLKELVS